jgi:hypothetical protein
VIPVPVVLRFLVAFLFVQCVFVTDQGRESSCNRLSLQFRIG